MKAPTYTAMEILTMCAKTDMDLEAFKIIAGLIDEEIELYEKEDMVTIIEASMMLFTRSMLLKSIKGL